MRIDMRTTMIIDDDLLRQAKKRAAEQGVSVSEIVNRALRESFAGQAVAVTLPPFRMVTFGRGEAVVDHQPAELARALEDEDERGVRGG
jgi:hypothetical protein